MNHRYHSQIERNVGCFKQIAFSVDISLDISICIRQGHYLKWFQLDLASGKIRAVQCFIFPLFVDLKIVLVLFTDYSI